MNTQVLLTAVIALWAGAGGLIALHTYLRHAARRRRNRYRYWDYH